MASTKNGASTTKGASTKKSAVKKPAEKTATVKSSLPAISVRTASTGMGAQHPEHRYGSALPSLVWVLTSRQWVKAPIHFFVIDHPDGMVLFDTGLDPAVASDPEYMPGKIGRFFLNRLFKLKIDADEGLAGKLAEMGVDPGDIKTVVISHLHFDHVGGIDVVPGADLLVARREWKRLSLPYPERDFILREHIETPDAKWREIDFAPTNDPALADFGECYDVMGDRSLVLLPTPGHTAGSLSLLVRAADAPPLLLVGDLTYDVDMLMDGRTPGTGSAEQLQASFARVRGLAEKLPGLVILPAHDAETQAKLEKAMAS